MNEKRGMRLTRQREAVLQELRKVKTHPSADEVYDMVRRKLPRVSLGTVYRNLEVLVEQCLAQKLVTGASPTRFDGNPEPHYHILCIECGKLEDVELPADGALADSLNRHAEKLTGYRIESHTLEFIGICPQCKKK